MSPRRTSPRPSAERGPTEAPPIEPRLRSAVYVAHLSLTDFRGYAALELPLESGPSVFIGANGEGKTNLLEAVGYAGSLSSHRVAADLPLVRAGADRAVVRVAASRSARSTLVEIEINPGRANRARLNRVPVSRPREVLGVLSAVMYGPTTTGCSNNATLCSSLRAPPAAAGRSWPRWMSGTPI